MGSAEKTEYKYSLDALKIAATILILFHHYQQVVYANGRGFFFDGKNVYFGRLVELFFVISGFLTYKYMDIIRHDLNFGEYIKKKAIRLLPMVMVSAIIYEIEIMIYRHFVKELFLGGDINPSGTLFNILGIQTGWASLNPMVNNPTWYISVLLLCYVIFYATVWLSVRWNISPVYFFIAVIMAGIGIVNYNINLPFLNEYSARGYYAFFAGLILAIVIEKYGITKRMTIIAIINVLLTAFFMVYFIHIYKLFDDFFWLTFVVYPSLITLCLTRPIENVFKNKLWKVWGGASYDAYIWHLDVYVLVVFLNKIFGPYDFISGPKCMLICVALIELFAIMSYKFIEKPLTGYFTKLFSRRES